jgi:hypothetical protein
MCSNGEEVAAEADEDDEAYRRLPVRAPIDEPPEPRPEPRPEPPPEPLPGPPAAVGGPGAYNLLALERLVEERRNGHPERAEEWATYLFFLREHAGPDGTVPASFDWLIEDTFGEILR